MTLLLSEGESEAFKSLGRTLLQVVTQSLRLISPRGFVPLCLVYEVGFGWCPSRSPDHTDVVRANLLGWTGLV